jgi:hypothetical protein
MGLQYVLSIFGRTLSDRPLSSAGRMTLVLFRRRALVESKVRFYFNLVSPTASEAWAKGAWQAPLSHGCSLGTFLNIGSQKVPLGQNGFFCSTHPRAAFRHSRGNNETSTRNFVGTSDSG